MKIVVQLVTLCGLLFSLLCGVAHAAGAQDPFTDVARQRFEEGVRHFDQGRFEDARAAFLQAWALKKHPAVLLNLAQSELRSNHPVDAARHFSQYLRENSSIEPGERNTATAGLSEARAKTGRIEIQVDLPGADVFVDDELVGKSPLPEPIDVSPGVHHVKVQVPGQPPQMADVSATQGVVVSAAIRFGQPSHSPAVQPTGHPANNDVSELKHRRNFPEWFVSDPVAWLSGGVTVVGLVGGIAFGVQANAASSNADNVASQIRVVAQRDPELIAAGRAGNPCAQPIAVTSSTNYIPACQQLRDNLDTRDTDKAVAIVGFGFAGVGAIATGVLYFVRTAHDQPASARSAPFVVAPMVGMHERGIVFGSTF